MSNRCTATIVERCGFFGGHDGEHDTHPGEGIGFRWEDGDPQPRVEITLDAVERAINAMNDAYVVFSYNEVDGTALPKHEQMQKAMYAALDAALNGDKP